MKVHVFVDSGYTTLTTGRKICGNCGNLESSAVHAMPPETPPEVRELERRKLGEA